MHFRIILSKLYIILKTTLFSWYSYFKIARMKLNHTIAATLLFTLGLGVISVQAEKDSDYTHDMTAYEKENYSTALKFFGQAAKNNNIMPPMN